MSFDDIRTSSVLQKMNRIYHIYHQNSLVYSIYENQPSGMDAQQRLRSAWAATQSDQSLCFLHGGSLDP